MKAGLCHRLSFCEDANFYPRLEKTTEKLCVPARAELEQSQQLMRVPLFTICALPTAQSPAPAGVVMAICEVVTSCAMACVLPSSYQTLRRRESQPSARNACCERVKRRHKNSVNLRNSHAIPCGESLMVPVLFRSARLRALAASAIAMLLFALCAGLPTQAGTMTRDTMLKAFPPPLIVGERDRELPVQPSSSRTAPPRPSWPMCSSRSTWRRFLAFRHALQPAGHARCQGRVHQCARAVAP